MLANWIRQTSTSPGGASDLTVAAVTGYPTLHGVFGTARYFGYAILDDSSGAPIEAGIGHMSDSTTLVRDRILATYSGGTYDDIAPAAVSLSNGTTYRVICTGEAGMYGGTIPGLFDHNAILGLSGGTRKLYSDGANNPNGTRALTANRQYVMPFLLNSIAEINELGCYVTTGVASSKVRFGLYALRQDGYPKTLLAESSSGSSSATSGSRATSSISAMRLYPGWYATSIVSDGAITVAAAATTQTRINPFGIPNTASNSQGVVADIYQSLTYADSGALMPTTWPTSGVTIETSVSVAQPQIWLGLV